MYSSPSANFKLTDLNKSKSCYLYLEYNTPLEWETKNKQITCFWLMLASRAS